MKKAFKYYAGSWAVLLILFNIISWVSPGWTGEEKYTPSFFIGYMFITLAFIGQLFVAYIALNKKDKAATFYSIPLVTISYAGLIMSFVVGGLCMLISPLPYWVGILVTFTILAAYAIAVMKAGAAAEIVADKDAELKAQTQFVKMSIANISSISDRAKSDAAKTECKKVYEAIRYSDPMSNSALALEEAQITVKMSELASSVGAGDDEKIKAVADELVCLIKDRNNKCKALK